MHEDRTVYYGVLPSGHHVRRTKFRAGGTAYAVRIDLSTASYWRIVPKEHFHLRRQIDKATAATAQHQPPRGAA